MQPNHDASDDGTRGSESRASTAQTNSESKPARPRLSPITKIVVAIGVPAIASTVVMSLVVPSFLPKLTVCRGTKPRSDIHALEAAAMDYALRNGGRWPDDLDVLVRPDMNGDRFVDQAALPVDPWGRAYRYDRRPRIYTLGRDGVRGGEGQDADVDNYDAR